MYGTNSNKQQNSVGDAVIVDLGCGADPDRFISCTHRVDDFESTEGGSGDEEQWVDTHDVMLFDFAEAARNLEMPFEPHSVDIFHMRFSLRYNMQDAKDLKDILEGLTHYLKHNGQIIVIDYAELIDPENLPEDVPYRKYKKHFEPDNIDCVQLAFEASETLDADEYGNPLMEEFIWIFQRA